MCKQKGFSLIEITVAMGLLGFVSIGVMKLFENINSGTRTVAKRSAVQDFNNSIKNQVMGKRDVCSINALMAFENQSLVSLPKNDVGVAGISNKIVVINGVRELEEGKASKSGQHRVEKIVHRIHSVQPVDTTKLTGNFTHTGKYSVSYNLQFCKTGNLIVECEGKNIGRMPSNLPEVDVLLQVAGGRVQRVECQTLDVPLLAESIDYTDKLQEKLCQAESVIVKLTGKPMKSSCGELLSPDANSIIPLYAKDDGALTQEKQFDYDQKTCNCCGKKCNCNPPSCGLGFEAISRGKETTCAWTDPTCCGMKRRITHKLVCRKPRAAIGHVVSPNFNYESMANTETPKPAKPLSPLPTYLPIPEDLFDADEPCGKREIASDTKSPDAPVKIEVEEGC